MVGKIVAFIIGVLLIVLPLPSEVELAGAVIQSIPAEDGTAQQKINQNGLITLQIVGVLILIVDIISLFR